MKPTEYTISPELAATMEAAFAPFARQKIDGMQLSKSHGVPLSQWISQQPYKTENPLHPALRLPLAAVLENLLALEGGQEGIDLLQALDGVIHGGGAPALIIHGLPKESAVSPMIREAFRQKMFPDPTEGVTFQPILRDEVKRTEPTGYRRQSHSMLHQDDSDITMSFGITGGINPRHTVVMGIEEFFEKAAARVRATGVEMSANTLRELAALPIWIVDPVYKKGTEPLSHRERNQKRLEVVKDLDIARPGARNRLYAPLIYPNPQYHAGEVGSIPHRWLRAPVEHFDGRFDFDLAAAPEHLQAVLPVCAQCMRDLAKNDGIEAKQGPVLQEGDALIYNNNLVMHGGGAYVNDKLSFKKRWGSFHLPARAIAPLEVETLPSKDYGARPGDSVAQPILIGKGVAPTIDPTTLER